MPEPIRRTELHVFGIDGRNVLQGRAKALPPGAVLEAKGHVRDPVSERSHVVSGNRLQVAGLGLRGVHKVAVAALKGEAVRQPCKARDDPADGRVDVLQIELGERGLAVAFVSRIVHKLPRLREGLHLTRIRVVAPRLEFSGRPPGRSTAAERAHVLWDISWIWGPPGDDLASLLRTIGLVLALLPAMLGLLWMFWNKRRQGWHDLLAGSVVIREDDSLKSLSQLAREAR